MDESQFQLAERGKRIIAYFIDIIPITLIVFGIYYFFLGFQEIFTNYLQRGDDIQPRIEFLSQRNNIRDISFLIWLLYCIILESSMLQATFGKRIMGMKVIRENGEKIDFKFALIRNMTKLLSAIIIFIGFFWILFDKKRQGWHDKIAKTLVVEN